MGFKSIAASIALLILTVSLIGIVCGLIIYFTSGSHRDRESAWRFTEVFVLSSLLCLIVVTLLRGYYLTSVVEGFIVVSISWILIPLVSALAYVHSIGLDLVDAFFESLSGFTGTGLTIFSKPENLPRIILLWRAVSQWVGELGVVVFAGTLLPVLHRVIRSVYVVERGERIAPTVIATMRKLVLIYVFYTAIGTTLFMISGMGFFDALTHSMTAIATGGMSTNSASIGYWFFPAHNWGIYISTVLIMILGALNFADHDALLRRRFRDFFNSIEVRWFFIFLVVIGLLIALPGIVRGDLDKALIDFYHFVSGYTTTGFQLTDLSKESSYTKFILVIGMIVGGATFSTAGGIKIKRAAILLKAIIWESARLFAPAAMVIRRKIGKEVLEEKDLLAVLNFVVIYMIVLTIITTVLTLHGYSFIDSLFETASALSCVGLSVGITSVNAPTTVKIALMVAMYLGRLEFAPLYLAIGYSYVRKLML